MSILSKVYKNTTQLRNHLYKKGVLKSHKVARPVVSVGNLTVGGTGKTPTIDFLIEKCHELSIKVGVVSRGYKGSYKGFAEVSLEPSNGPLYFGDEPFMLKRKHQSVPIFVCKNRVRACEELISHYPETQLILADDAFQHRKLQRNLDIVLFDATVNVGLYKPLPQGLLRESLQGLSRAQFVILNKMNLCDDRQKDEALNWLKGEVKKLGAKRPQILLGEYVLKRFVNLYNGKVVTLLKDEVQVVSGIGRPEAFEKMLLKSNIKIAGSKVFKDHYSFRPRDIEQVLQEANGNPIVITEKDGVKIRPLIGNHNNFWVAEIGLELKGYKLNDDLEEFYEVFRRLVR